MLRCAWYRVGRKVGSAIGRDKLVDLDSLRVAALPLNSVTYLLMNRPQEDAPIFVYNHVVKMQFIVQIYQLMEPSMLEYLHSTTLLPVFDSHTGWYPAETLTTLRVMALKALPERINSFLSLPDSVIWEDFQSKHTSSAITASSSAAAGPSGGAKPGSATVGGNQGYMINMDASAIHEDAAEFGFNEQSSGLFVVFNRTLNTLRAYLSDMPGTVDPESIALTDQGAVQIDHLRTVDGIYLGKVLSWLKAYSTIMQDIVAATQAVNEFGVYSGPGGRSGARSPQDFDLPATKRSRGPRRSAAEGFTSPAATGLSRGGRGRGNAGRAQSGRPGRGEAGASASLGSSAGGSGSSSMPLMRGVQAFELFEGSQEDSQGTSDTSDSEY